MNYSIIIEKHNGTFRAFIPALSNLSAEGITRDDALSKARRAAESYLSQVEVVDVETSNYGATLRPDSPQAWIQAAGKFVGDEEAMLQHIEEIYAERRKQHDITETKDSALINGE